MRNKKSLILKFLAVQLAILIVACTTNPITHRQQFMIVSEDAAIKQSASAYTEMMGTLARQNKLVNDPQIQKRVETITSRLVAQGVYFRPETEKWRWEVHVIDDPKTLNAWCMAGGRMAVYSGLMNQLKLTDDELAQVMGHEIGHALASHSAEKLSIAMASQLGIALLALSTNDEAERQKRLIGGTLAAQLIVTLPNSRQAEEEADYIGMLLAARAGYNPNAAISLWQKMIQAGDGKETLTFLSTHPASRDRIKALQAQIPEVEGYYRSKEKRAVYDLANHRLIR